MDKLSKTLLSLAFVGALTFTMAGCGDSGNAGSGNSAPAGSATTGVSGQPDSATTTAAPSGDTSFVNDVLTTPKMKIEITDHKVIPVGETGNEYGDKPVIAFWYKVTNLTEADLDPTTSWMLTMTAYQDNNPNAENKLEVGMLPDAQFRDTQMENIKKDGTVENAVAYELDDTTTDVTLVASDDLGFSEIGTMTYTLS